MKEPRFFNRELSWLEFNQRVLEEAKDTGVPLLERLKFLAITASNLDEFFMVRVGGLALLKAEKVTRPDPSGLVPEEQLERISARVRAMVNEQYACYLEWLEPQLAAAGIRRVRSGEWKEPQVSYLERLFQEEIYPVATPVAIDPETDPPLFSSRLLHVAVRFRPAEGADDRPRFAVIPFGRRMNRIVTLPSSEQYEYALLEDVIAFFIDKFFPGDAPAECVPFRITRNADVSARGDDDDDDLMTRMEEVLRARKRSDCIRLEVAAPATKTTVSWLQRLLRAEERSVYQLPGPLDFSTFMSLASLGGYEALKYEAWPPQPVPDLDPQESLFAALARRPLLLNHPYETFDPVVRFLEEAADDPDVLAIKQCLYRTSPQSPIVTALQRAAEKGKYVTAIVELKARFDEERNIEWARRLEDAGVQVIYGIRGLKTHSKVCVVVRREPQGVVRYVHFGTGNYNENTARVYSDISYLTADEDLGFDASVFFNTITGAAQPQAFRKIEAAPLGLRGRIRDLIDGETERKKQGHKAAIMAKLNSLVDNEIIEALYRASQAGVKVQLNIRGICCLRPGVPGLSENITVVSIVDRFLEHARILYFHHGGQESLFISSADWMPRNLDRRVELLVPIEDAASRRRLINVLKTCFGDTAKAWNLLADGRYERASAGRKKLMRSQEILYRLRDEEVEAARKARPSLFEPLRPAD